MKLFLRGPLAASHVHRAQVFGRCSVQSGMALYRFACNVMSHMSLGSRTTIRLIEAKKAVLQCRMESLLRLRSTRVWRQNEAMTPCDPQDRTMERLGLYWNWNWSPG